jgi:bifunctional DNase/RNase
MRSTALLAVALLALPAAGASARTLEVEVQGLRLDATTGSPVVQLVEKGGARRALPIWIGPFEAQAIAIEMAGTPPPRPLTHDLMKQLVERLGGRLDHVVIEDLRGATYFATLYLARPGGEGLTVDARPSDAIALALRLHGPILVDEGVFAKAAAAEGEGGPGPVHLWGLTVQDLTPEIAVFFPAPQPRGVLVADVVATGPAHEAARGDVITALDDEPVASAAELASRAGARASREPVRLSVRRNGRPITLRFAAD